MHKIRPVLAALFVLSITATGGADNRTSPAGPAVVAGGTVRVIGFRRSATASADALVAAGAGNQPKYTGGPYFVAVDVQNVGATAAAIGVKLDAAGTPLETSLTVPPNATRTAVFTDSAGITTSCSLKSYKITLSGPGTGNLTRPARVSPGCTFTSSITSDWLEKSPDHVDAMQKNHVYISGAKLLTPPTCQGGPKISASIASQSTASSPSIVVQAKDPAGVVRAQNPAAFPLGPKQNKDVVLDPIAAANKDVAPKLTIGITDWTKSLGPALVDGHVTVNTTKSCTLDFALLD